MPRSCACPRSSGWPPLRSRWPCCGLRSTGRWRGDELAMTAQIRFHDLTLGYDRHPAVHHLSGAVNTGALMAVVGPNGAGKSTLFKGVVGAIKPLAGQIERNDTKPEEIAYLPQVAEIDRSFPISLYDMVAM